ncbi:MAG: prolyl-tRNA synthetase associated domain-containing protein [Christensenellales bacterium]
MADYRIYEKKPAPEGRSPLEMASYELLDSLAVKYQRVDHEPAMTIDDCKDVDALLGIGICKNLFLCTANKQNFYLLLMPGHKPFKSKVFSKLVGSSRLSFASPEHMAKHLGVSPGSVSVLCLLEDKEQKVRLVIDKELLKDEFFGCHPCANTSSIKISTADLFDKVLPAMERRPLMVEFPCDSQ